MRISAHQRPRLRSSGQRLLGWVGLVAVCIQPAAAAAPLGAEPIEVPGGMASVSRLLGDVSTEPAEFADSLSRVLLTQIVGDHSWHDNRLRVLLLEYLETAAGLESEVGGGIVLETNSKSGRRRFEDLAESLGYDTKRRKKHWELIPKDSERAGMRRLVAQALGWDLVGAANRLSDGELVTLEFASDHAAAPLPLDLWSSLTGRHVTPASALADLAEDQRLGLVLEGLRRLNRETRELVERKLLRTFYESTPIQFYRYAAALELVDGLLRVPGGEGAVASWATLLGVSPREPVRFMQTLLEDRDGRAAYLWHALFFAPPGRTPYFLDLDGSVTKADQKFLRKFYRRLDENRDTVHFDSVTGRDIGFAAFVRSLEPADDAAALDLRGGARLWYNAVRGDDPVASVADATRLAEKSARRELDSDDFLLKVLTETVDAAGLERIVLPRLMRTAGVLRDRPELYGPEVVILLARAADWFPMALPVVERMEISSEKTFRSYLVTVTALGQLPPTVESHALVEAFQGGAELVRILDRSGVSVPGFGILGS